MPSHPQHFFLYISSLPSLPSSEETIWKGGADGTILLPYIRNSLFLELTCFLQCLLCWNVPHPAEWLCGWGSDWQHPAILLRQQHQGGMGLHPVICEYKWNPPRLSPEIIFQPQSLGTRQAFLSWKFQNLRSTAPRLRIMLGYHKQESTGISLIGTKLSTFSFTLHPLRPIF